MFKDNMECPGRTRIDEPTPIRRLVSWSATAFQDGSVDVR